MVTLTGEVPSETGQAAGDQPCAVHDPDGRTGNVGEGGTGITGNIGVSHLITELTHCEYVHEPRLTRLSDHSALTVRLTR